MFKTINFFNYKNRTKEILQILKLSQNSCIRMCSTTNNELEINKTKILNTLNNSTKGELMSLGISKGRSDQIVTWRTENGRYENFDQMLKINGFGEKIMKKVISTILKPLNKEKSDLNTVEKSKKKIGMQYSIPSVTELFRPEIKSCLSLYIGVASIAWCRFEINLKKPCLLTDWKYENVLDRKLHINDLIKCCSTLLNEIPDSDCYVLENPKIAQQGQPGNPAQVNINVQKSQLIAIISYALSSRKYLQERKYDILKVKPNLFYLKNYISSRLFDRLVGSETVSATQAVLELLRTEYNFEDKPDDLDNYNIDEINNIRGNISVPLNFRNDFQNFEGIQREFIGQSMLIGLSFIRLCLIKCPRSMDKINPNSKANKI